jgi:NAD(P)-dependent dehydrogenase (short-subunit alcohol dehydrogenase family)
MGRLDNKVALITGAGGGFGRTMSVVFAREGARIFAVDSDEDRARETAEAVAEAGGDVRAIRTDVTSKEEIASLLKMIESESGQLDILVNNAAITQREDFRHTTDEQWQEILDVNLTAVMRLSRDGLSLLKVSGKSSIINLSSIMASVHVRQLSAYSTTKAALAGMSRAMAVEYAAFNVRVNYLCPGYAETAMTDRILRNPAVRKGLLDRTPLNRFATPEDISYAALFLASDEAAFVTGEGLTVDGGMSIQL